jgi:hypothetical protein
MKKIMICMAILVSMASCKKESSSVCYQCRDLNNNLLNKYCGANEDDAYQNALQGGINGNTNFTKPEFLQQCPRSN